MTYCRYVVIVVSLIALPGGSVSSVSPATGAPFPLALGVAMQISAALTNPGPACVGARSPGFFCRNQDGKNPNMPADEFLLLAEAAAARLGQGGLTRPDGTALDGTDIARAVCNNRDQLLRHLATLALNLEANLISLDTPLLGEVGVMTVGEAFNVAAMVAGNRFATRQDRNAIKDVLDRINNNENTVLGNECVVSGEEEGR